MADKGKASVNPIQVQKFLKGVNYPASKSDLVKTAKKEGAGQQVIDTLNRLPDKKFDAPTEVTKAIGKFE